ncbi:hypothetical protein B0T16DRAFT_459307 [Cercophora newfieldiana]|uniref:R3H domain-containing protein n=1 Tax=Cercophora newfieldiana TaxID=92897 RepID=A0AA40CLQ3_9PEZI|nr:hypothetical protein B0T16DRAFT_459307 [Cercophora newfieldiana]
MATMPTMAKEVKKLSFAKVAAASATKDSTSVAAIARTPAPSASRDKRENSKVVPTAPAVVPEGAFLGARISAAVEDASRAALGFSPSAQMSGAEEISGLKDLKLETRTPNLVVNGSSSIADRAANAAANSHTPSDDNSQKADSSSDLGTKPPSMDGKSITSGTTFALDEKESLRPDDSASVKAAAEDDDAFSVRGSYIAGSRMGSDIAARFQRIQLGDMPLRPIPVANVLPGHHGPGIATPPSGGSEKQPVTDSKSAVPDAVSAMSVSAFMSQNPDDKLLEAMQSPKDRLFLLRLEQQVIEFVQDSKEPFMDLPPSNSFCRMLTHKLADYYHMTHSFEAVAGAVRIYRTPFCRIPPSLSTVSVGVSASSSPAPAVMPRKIMQRGKNGDGATGSAGASKPGSEDGSDSKDKGAIPKEKLTREEREERYNKARQRIFGADKGESSTPEGEDPNGVSRASSVSTKDRSNVGKKKTNKQRRDDSESFDSRSQYVVWCGPQQPTWAPAGPQFYPPNAAPYSGQYQQTYQAAAIPPAFPPNQPFQQYGPQYPGMTTYPAPSAPQPVPPQPQRYQQHPNPLMPAPYTTPVPNGLPQLPNGMPPASNGMPQQAWQQQPIQQQQPMQQPIAQPMPQPMQQPLQQQQFNQISYPPSRTSPNPSGIPYAYGQLPANANPNDPKSQHPIPGSYTRQPFNPKSQTFVPANGIVPMQPPNPYGTSSPLHGSPQFNSPHMSYSGFQQPLPQPVYPGAGAYGMARQGSNNSMTQYHPVQQPLGPSHALQHMAPNSSPHIPTKSIGPPGAVQTFSHLPNYGNPATLPQKPT